MKRVMMAVAGGALVLTAIVVARASSGEGPDPEAQPRPSSTAVQTPDEATRKHIEWQAEQLDKAQQDLKEQVDQQSERLRQSQDASSDPVD